MIFTKMRARRRAKYYCVCGCGRLIQGDMPWDGYHGPDHQRPEKN